MKTARLSTMIAGVTLLGGILLAPTAAFAASPAIIPPPDPGACTTKPSVNDDQPWYATNYSHSTIKTNACSMKVRAVAHCTDGVTAYGNSVISVGSVSTASCPDEVDVGVSWYTHQDYYSGAWH